MFRILSTALAAALVVGCSNGKESVARKPAVQPKPGDPHVQADHDLVTIKKSTPKSAEPILITSGAFRDGQEIPHRNSDYGEKVSPALSWTGVPANAQSLVILCEDPDAQVPKPFVHWVMYNVPPKLTSLREAIPGSARLPALDGALQGKNSRGSVGYMGPRPPGPDAPHHYHFMIFALDTKLDDLLPAADHASVVRAMQGHVLAQGLLVGTYDAKESK